MIKKKKLVKVVKIDWGDFKSVYLVVSLFFLISGLVYALFFGIDLFSILLVSTPSWFWALLLPFEVKRKVYWKEVRE